MLRQRGIDPDSEAGARFRTAAAAVDGARAAGELGDEAAAEAAEALLALAAAGDQAELRSYLTPDPSVEAQAWTVLCYQVGDVSPSAIRDFSAPDAALATLAQCDDPDHAASELLCSTAEGLRWAALTRAGERLAFHLPTEETCTPGQFGALDVEQAVAAWRRQLRAWARHDEGRWDDQGHDGPAARSLAALHRRLDTLDERLDAIARSIALLAARVADLAEPVADITEPATDLTDEPDRA